MRPVVSAHDTRHATRPRAAAGCCSAIDLRMASDPHAPAPADSTRRLHALAFIAAAIILFFAVDLAADVLARISIEGQSIELAAREHLYYASVQVPGTVFLSLPYVGLAFIGLPVLRRRGALAGVLFLLCGVALLGGVYGFGYQQSALAMVARHWTAAALTMGMMPILSVPVLLLAFGVRFLATRGRTTRPLG